MLIKIAKRGEGKVLSLVRVALVWGVLAALDLLRTILLLDKQSDDAYNGTCKAY